MALSPAMICPSGAGVSHRQGLVAGSHLGQDVACQDLEPLGHAHAAVLPRQLARPPRDPQREIGDPLPIAIDLQDRGHSPQVRGDGFVEGQDPQALLLDLDLAAIGILLLVLHVGDQVKTPFADGLHALLQRIDHRGRQAQEAAPEHVLVAERVPCRRQPWPAPAFEAGFPRPVGLVSC